MSATPGRIGALAGVAVLGLSVSAAGAPPASPAAAATTYHCVGFDEPIRNDMQVAKGRVLPLRAKLATDSGGFADQTVVKAAPNFPSTTPAVVTGAVRSDSMVPDLRSSAKRRIVMPGHRRMSGK